MTGKNQHHDQDDERLTRLYREQGDVDPGPGVDQNIRARAREEVRPSSLPRPAKWLGGAAVAASLFVVVAIVTNTQPPEPELPRGESRQTSPEAGASEETDVSRLQAPEAKAPAAGQQKTEGAEPGATEAADAGDSAYSASRVSGDDRLRAEPEALEEQTELSDSDSKPDTDTMLQRRTRWSAADEAAETARGHYEAVGKLGAADGADGEAQEPVQLPAESGFDLSDEASADAENSLWLIQQLILIGNAERARAEIEKFGQRYPDREIPPGLISELERLNGATEPD